MLNGATLLWFGHAAWATSVPGSYMGAWLVMFYAAIVLGLSWLVRVAVYVFLHRSAPTEELTRRAVTSWIAFPAAATVIYLGLPMRVRFFVSLPALRAEVARLRTSPESFPARPLEADEPTRIGWLWFERVESIPGGARFLVADSGLLDRCGFAWSADGEPANVGGEDWYWPYFGEWWMWRESW